DATMLPARNLFTGRRTVVSSAFPTLCWVLFMKLGLPLLIALTMVSPALTQEVKRDISYASRAAERQVLDVYAPKGAKDLPVVFWIHGGGWQTGDKSEVQEKPRAFTERGFVFVSTNYRLL